MESSNFPTRKPSPRRELQGPRPTPLKVHKDSCKIKKPPPVPQQSQRQQPPPQYRPPVIIYTVSPKVIHADASEFMTLVQRLTGSSSSSSSSSSSLSSSSYCTTSSSSYVDKGGSISPAARFATIEKTNLSEGEKLRKDDPGRVDVLEMGGATVELAGSFPGILSPVPSSLPPISPNFFSSLPDPNLHGFLHDLSPIFNARKNYIEGSFMPSPSTFLSTQLTSPFPSMDLFNSFLDF